MHRFSLEIIEDTSQILAPEKLQFKFGGINFPVSTNGWPGLSLGNTVLVYRKIYLIFGTARSLKLT